MLFSTLMVQAELDGRKTMTRRMKGLEQINKDPDKWNFIDVDSPFKPADIFWFEGKGERMAIKCPFGRPGDILWVRETFFKGYVLDHNDNIPDNSPLHYWYFADTRDARPGDMSDSRCAFLFGNNKKDWPHWKPSIHMPKEASRIWLQVTNIRVERLQDISQEDAQAEGVFPPAPHRCGGWKNELHDFKDCFRCAFKVLWNQINGPSGNTWDANPWVWVISFKVLSTTGKPDLNNL